MIVAGNAFSAATSAPQLLPAAAGRIGQWLPAGAGGNLLRSTAYFNGNGAAGHLSVLIIWSVLGLATVFAGQRFPFRAAGPARNRPEPASPPARYDLAGDDSPLPGRSRPAFAPAGRPRLNQEKGSPDERHRVRS